MPGRYILRLFYTALLLVSVISTASAQDYIAYQRILNRTDEDVIAKDYAAALLRLDSVYADYDFIFAKHCMKALEISCVADDTARARTWLEKAYKQGIPEWIVRQTALTKKVSLYANCQSTLRQYEQLHAVYLSSINLDLRRKIDSLMVIDQAFTYKVNDGMIPFRYIVHFPRWLRNNKRQYAFLRQITEEYGFPGERLIGLNVEDTDSLHLSLPKYGPRPEEINAQIMLIHYFSSNRNSMNELLAPQVEKGFLPAYQFACFNDFMARSGKRRYRNNFYNAWHTDPNAENLPAINERRRAVGLTDSETASRNRAFRQLHFGERNMDQFILVE